MIPPFDENGYLPPGIHPATMEEIEERFGLQSVMRANQIESLRWLIAAGEEGGLERLIINGSFVTDVEEPIDVDAVLLIQRGLPTTSRLLQEIEQGIPFLSLEVVTDQDEFVYFTEDFFASDREIVAKGMIEVLL